MLLELDVVAHTCNFSTRDAEAGGSYIWCQPRQATWQEHFSKKKKKDVGLSDTAGMQSEERD
jgi:hypothetical protein